MKVLARYFVQSYPVLEKNRENAIFKSMAAKRKRLIDRTDDELRDALRAWVRENGALVPKKLRQSDQLLARGLCRIYGSLEAAADSLNLPYAGRKEANPEKMKVHLEAIFAEHGSVSDAELRAIDSSLHGRLNNHYGSVKQAAKAFGLKYDERKTDWTPQKVLNRIKAAHEAGLRLSSAGLSGHAGYTNLFSVAKKMFGSWENALRTAGLEVPDPGEGTRIGEDEIMSRARAWVAEYGPMRASKLHFTESGLLTLLCKHYGNLERGALALGLPFARNVGATCGVCGRRFNRLDMHLKQRHHMTLVEHHETYGNL